jgi:alpha-1,2-mannosyltransferase
VWNTLFLGQVNLLLLVLVIGDVQRAARGRTTGYGIGLAAALKLTPLIFVGVLLLAGRVKSGMLAVATFAAASLTCYLVAPQASSVYWSRYLLDTSRIGDATYISNQSPYGSLARLLGGTSAIGVWFLLVPMVLGATGLAVATTFARRDDWLGAATAAGMTALLTSPISWSHHWVWALPAIAFAARSGPSGRRWAIAAFGFGVLAPQWWVPARLQVGLHGPVTMLANSFTLAGLAFLASMSRRALRMRRDGSPPGRSRPKTSDGGLSSGQANRSPEIGIPCDVGAYLRRALLTLSATAAVSQGERFPCSTTSSRTSSKPTSPTSASGSRAASPVTGRSTA